MEVLIRPFRPDDWDGIFFLDRACFEPPYRLEYPRLRALVEDPGVVVLVIEAHAPGDGGEEESALVGSLLLRHEKGTERLVLISVMVDPGFRRVGLGRRLVGWAEKIARSRSLRELLAPLEADNAAGSAFLTALGFVPEPGSAPFFEDAAGGNLWRRPVAEQTMTERPSAPPPQAARASAPGNGASQSAAPGNGAPPSDAAQSTAPAAPAEAAPPSAPESASGAASEAPFGAMPVAPPEAPTEAPPEAAAVGEAAPGVAPGAEVTATGKHEAAPEPGPAPRPTGAPKRKRRPRPKKRGK